jgi:hypothetical protein
MRFSFAFCGIDKCNRNVLTPYRQQFRQKLGLVWPCVAVLDKVSTK